MVKDYPNNSIKDQKGGSGIDFVSKNAAGMSTLNKARHSLMASDVNASLSKKFTDPTERHIALLEGAQVLASSVPIFGPAIRMAITHIDKRVTGARRITVDDLTLMIRQICKYDKDKKTIEKVLHGRSIAILPDNISISKLTSDLRTKIYYIGANNGEEFNTLLKQLHSDFSHYPEMHIKQALILSNGDIHHALKFIDGNLKKDALNPQTSSIPLNLTMSLSPTAVRVIRGLVTYLEEFTDNHDTLGELSSRDRAYKFTDDLIEYNHEYWGKLLDKNEPTHCQDPEAEGYGLYEPFYPHLYIIPDDYPPDNESEKYKKFKDQGFYLSYNIQNQLRHSSLDTDSLSSENKVSLAEHAAYKDGVAKPRSWKSILDNHLIEHMNIMPGTRVRVICKINVEDIDLDLKTNGKVIVGDRVSRVKGKYAVFVKLDEHPTFPENAETSAGILSTKGIFGLLVPHNDSEFTQVPEIGPFWTPKTPKLEYHTAWVWDGKSNTTPPENAHYTKGEYNYRPAMDLAALFRCIYYLANNYVNKASSMMECLAKTGSESGQCGSHTTLMGKRKGPNISNYWPKSPNVNDWNGTFTWEPFSKNLVDLFNNLNKCYKPSKSYTVKVRWLPPESEYNNEMYLNLKVGDSVTVVAGCYDNMYWWYGSTSDATGLFPRQCVDILNTDGAIASLPLVEDASASSGDLRLEPMSPEVAQEKVEEWLTADVDDTDEFLQSEARLLGISDTKLEALKDNPENLSRLIVETEHKIGQLIDKPIEKLLAIASDMGISGAEVEQADPDVLVSMEALSIMILQKEEEERARTELEEMLHYASNLGISDTELEDMKEDPENLRTSILKKQEERAQTELEELRTTASDLGISDTEMEDMNEDPEKLSIWILQKEEGLERAAEDEKIKRKLLDYARNENMTINEELDNDQLVDRIAKKAQQDWITNLPRFVDESSLKEEARNWRVADEDLEGKTISKIKGLILKMVYYTTRDYILDRIQEKEEALPAAGAAPRAERRDFVVADDEYVDDADDDGDDGDDAVSASPAAAANSPIFTPPVDADDGIEDEETAAAARPAADDSLTIIPDPVVRTEHAADDGADDPPRVTQPGPSGRARTPQRTRTQQRTNQSRLDLDSGGETVPLRDHYDGSGLHSGGAPQITNNPGASKGGYRGSKATVVSIQHKHTKRKHTKRKHTKRKHTKRKHKKRKHTKRKHAKRKHTKRKHTKRKK